MRIERRNVALVLVVLVLGAAQVAFAPDVPRSTDAGPLFPDFAPAAVRRVALESGDGAQRVELARLGERWIAPAAYGHPAVDRAVDDLLGRVAALRRERVSAETSAHALYGVGDGGVRVLLEGEGGLLAAFVQGRPLDRPGTASEVGSYVRTIDGDEVYRARLLPLLDPSVQRWIDARLQPFDRADARALRLRAPSGAELVLERDGEGAWKLADSGRAVQTALVDLLLEKAAESYFASVETTGRARELGAPGFALEVRGAEGGAGLWLGSASQDGRLRALRWDVDASGASTPLEDDAGAGGTGWIVVLPAPTAQRIEARAKDLWTAVGSGAW